MADSPNVIRLVLDLARTEASALLEEAERLERQAQANRRRATALEDLHLRAERFEQGEQEQRTTLLGIPVLMRDGPDDNELPTPWPTPSSRASGSSGPP